MTDLACIGSNHVPGHTSGCPRLVVAIAEAIDELPGLDEVLAGTVPLALPPVPAGLSIELTVNIVRVGRRRCPRCRRVRVLSRMTAFSNDQPVGYGVSRCGECAGLRRAHDGDA